MAEWTELKDFKSRHENNNLNSTPGFLTMYTVKLTVKKGAESIMIYRAFSENAATPDINNIIE